jgi:DHA1 family multidrug resistance protein-like MFS transporter
MWVTAPWQVTFIDILSGFLWAGYNLANFNLLLALSPTEQRPRAVALYQTAVFGSAMLGPLLGGYLADLFSFHLIFGISSIGRLLGVVTFLWFTVRVVTRRNALQAQATPVG